MTSDSLTAAPRTAADFEEELERFSGTEKYYKSAFGGLRYTEGIFHATFRSEGVLYDGEHTCNGAYWLIHDIATRQKQARELTDGFQLWKLAVDDRPPLRGATLTCRGDSDLPAVITERYPWTDFPLRELKLYVIDNVLLLPGEY